MQERVYILGGYQSDFSQNWYRSDLDLSPNGEDANLRFGVKVGLPINIRSGL